MKIYYNWLKQYVPEIPQPEKLRDIFTYHLCEVEGIEGQGGDTVFDVNILPNRAHDLLSHLGIARELASLLNLKFVDPTSKYKIPESKSTDFKIEIENDKCRRYMGRIVRNVKIGGSPEWVVKYLGSLGQRSINNMVDAANLVMFDCGQPTHVFDLNKVKDKLIARLAKDGEELTTLDNKECQLKSTDLIIADAENALAIAGVKGGKIAEVDNNTKDIVMEVANFDPIFVRKTAQSLNIFTDARKRFENNLSSELCSYAMVEFSALIAEMCPEAIFEDVVDEYPVKQKEQKLSFKAERVSSILGVDISKDEIKNILERYNFVYSEKEGDFEIEVPAMRFDLNIEEDMAEEIGRIIGYDRVLPKVPEINFKPQTNEIYTKMLWAREKLLYDGYSEVMTYVFREKGEVEVLASASDKKFLRTNLSDGLKESLKLNQINAPLLEMNEIKIFEIGTVFTKNGEEIHVAYADKKEVKEITLEDFFNKNYSSEEHGYFSAEKFLVLAPSRSQVSSEENSYFKKFKSWSLFPFIARDIAVWVKEKEDKEKIEKILTENATDLLIRKPYIFDSFTNQKDGRTSYAFRLVFQSYERTLTDAEVNEIMTKITNKIKENNDWQVR
jgi:phenylalanyl-tRNA synthetase beta chain